MYSADVYLPNVGDLLIKTAKHPVTGTVQNRTGIILYKGTKGRTLTIKWFGGDKQKPEERWMREEEVVITSQMLQKMVMIGEYKLHKA